MIALIGPAALGGGIGAALRYSVDQVISGRWRGEFPLGIVLVNVSGSLALGVLVGLLAGGAEPQGMYALLGTGVLGGYTTFSTASLDTVRLARAGRTRAALVHTVGTMVASVAAALLGLWLGSLLRG